MASSIFVVNGGILTVGGTTVLFPDGVASAPAMAFLLDPTTGFRRSGAGTIIFDTSGADALAFGGGGVGVTVHATSPLQWGSVALSTPDVILNRTGIGKLSITGSAAPILQFGGTTSSCPAIRQNGNTLEVIKADASSYTNIAVAGLYTALNGNTLLITQSTPSISSGFGTSPSVTSNNGTASFVINVGTGAAATSGVIGLPTAANGWNVEVTDITAASNHTGLRTIQTAGTTTTATIESQNSAGAATAWAASSLLQVIAMAR